MIVEALQRGGTITSDSRFLEYFHITTQYAHGAIWHPAQCEGAANCESHLQKELTVASSRIINRELKVGFIGGYRLGQRRALIRGKSFGGGTSGHTIAPSWQADCRFAPSGRRMAFVTR